MEHSGSEKILTGLIYYPVRTLGIGNRIGIWTVGCSLHCPGCITPHNWEFDPDTARPIPEILQEITAYKVFGPDGITISGGEPFDQAPALRILLEGLREEGFRDIMVYTGYLFENLKAKYRWIHDLIDVLVDGPFMEGNTASEAWKGSDNQRMILLTDNEQLIWKYQAYQKECPEHRKI